MTKILEKQEFLNMEYTHKDSRENKPVVVN